MPDEVSRPLQSLRPKLVFRVGVTGTRSIPPETLDRIYSSTVSLFRLIQDEVRALAREVRLTDVYETGTEGACAVEMRMISPLAEGADRLAAEIALKFGYRLLVPLPFVRKDYETDFPSTLDAFRLLLAKGEVVELDGARSDATGSYEAVGRYVVRNCDLLIGVWNGQPAKGGGGTAEIIRYAARSNMPIWWIHTADGEPRLIDSLRTFRDQASPSTGPAACRMLLDYIRRTLIPPAGGAPEGKGSTARLAALRDRIGHDDADPLKAYLREPSSPRADGVWRTHALFFDRLAPKGPDRPGPSSIGTDTYWHRNYARADQLSTAYANKYRSSYVMIFIVALLFAMVSIAGSVFSTAPKIAIDLVLASLIFVIVAANRMQRWHERWISYRLLAELCRKQEILAPLGRCLPSSEISRIDAQNPEGEEGAGAPRGWWVAWYFQALQRDAPWPEKSPDLAKRRAFALARSLIEEQSIYHRQRATRASTADRRLAIGDTLFVASTLLLAACLAILAFGGSTTLTQAIEILAGLLSAVSATIVGLRAYSEFSHLAQESRRMTTLLREVSSELGSLNLDASLASVELGSLCHRLSVLMMHDIDGWAQLFRLRTVEVA